MPSEKRIKIKSLPVPVQKALMRAFAQAGCMDLYRGDALMYLDVIRTQLRDTMAANRKLEQRMNRIIRLAQEHNPNE